MTSEIQARIDELRINEMRADAAPVDDTPALRAAYGHLRATLPGGRHWPADFAAGMADPLRRRLVRLEVWLQGSRRTLAPAQARAGHGAAPMPSPSAVQRSSAPSWAPHGGMDRKRAAAGERDDD